jgi:WD40 repeat protein
MRITLVFAVSFVLVTLAQAGDEKLDVRTFKGHTKEVGAIAFNTDGTLLATGSDDQTVRIWDTATGKELHTLKADERLRVEAVAFSPDGKLLASAGWDATVRLWDPVTGKLERKFEAGEPNHDSVRGIAFSPDGKKLIAVGMLVPAGDNEPMPIFDVASGKRERTVDSKITNGLSSVAFSRDGKVFATNNYYEGPQLWDFATGRALKLFKHPAVGQIVFSRDGSVLASVANDEMIRLWDVPGAKELRTLRAKGSTVSAVAFSRDGKHLASAGHKDGSVKLWNVATGEELRSLKGHTARSTRVAFHPDGKQLASGGADGMVKLWDVTEIRPAKKALDK